MPLKGLFGPYVPPPPIPSPVNPVPSPGETEADRLYASLMQPLPEPSLLDRMRSGVEVPRQPMFKPKGRVARTFLRGLVGGFKNSGAGAVQGKGGASALRSAMRAEGANLTDAARADYYKALAEKNRRPEVVDPLDAEYQQARIDAARALAERRRRPDRPLAPRASRATGKGPAAKKSTHTSDRAYFKAIAEQMLLGGADPDQVDVWLQEQLRSLADVESNRRRGIAPGTRSTSGTTPFGERPR